MCSSCSCFFGGHLPPWSDRTAKCAMENCPSPHARCLPALLACAAGLRCTWGRGSALWRGRPALLRRGTPCSRRARPRRVPKWRWTGICAARERPGAASQGVGAPCSKVQATDRTGSSASGRLALRQHCLCCVLDSPMMAAGRCGGAASSRPLRSPLLPSAR